jgi:hypothetical protein
MEINEQWDEITASILVSIRKNDKRKRSGKQMVGHHGFI